MKIKDYFSFRLMLTGTIIKIFNLIGFILITVGAFIGLVFASFAGGVGAFFFGLIAGIPGFIIAQLLWRIIMEGLQIKFAIYQALTDCNKSLHKIAGESPNVLNVTEVLSSANAKTQVAGPTAQPKPAPAAAVCRACKKTLKENAVFCDGCGEKV